jgi:hypothetical protein
VVATREVEFRSVQQLRAAPFFAYLSSFQGRRQAAPPLPEDALLLSRVRWSPRLASLRPYVRFGARPATAKVSFRVPSVPAGDYRVIV